ncbi:MULTISPECIES: ABC transporter substrate-binding protein [Saccharothrix]|uniref:ABC transporter substrate-binding protein n=1 Tax=Saccharothrix TaxID=2071 RepID=UPI00093CF692|nr:ABC transporter substrate-binding protein [Saccharothrix sp. CB00851]OKI33359.1 sulfonate ABC transporter substrate-binding protein [Saccharothrix sp. CB00851]
MSAKRSFLVTSLVVLTALAGCSRIDRGDAPAQDKGAAAEVRLGYLPNVTHAAALIGVDKGYFAAELGGTKLVTQAFNAGPQAVNALLGSSLDVSFIGTGPAINAHAKSDGEAVRLVAGAASGGAQLVVKPGIGSPADLAGKVVASPQLGSTQDIAVKKWLADAGLDAQVTNIDNAQALDLFKRGDIEGAWVPEPWSSRLVLEAGAKVLVDEKTLWPGGTFPTTVVLVRTKFLQEHPRTVEALLRGHLAAIDFASRHEVEAKQVVNAALQRLTGKALGEDVLDRAFDDIELTADPEVDSFPRLAQDAVTAGVAKKAANVAGLADFTLLNKVLSAAGKPAVDTAGLDEK